MARPPAPVKDIQAVDLLIISSLRNEQRGTTTIIRVVDWITGGKHYPQLEKREFFSDQNTGDLKMGKAKGFTKKDLVQVQEAWGEIMVALGGAIERPVGYADPPQRAPAASVPATAPSAEQDF